MRKSILISLVVFLLSTTSRAQLPGLIISGNPTDTINGATWKYNATIDSIVYNLEGIFFAPDSTSMHSAIIINHGTGNNAYSFPRVEARRFVHAGFVCIATNYTHSSGVPCGSPGDCNDTLTWGASPENILRGMKCWDILASLSYVDSTCIMDYGTSRGAFVTTALAASFPHKFRAACHVAGGVSNNAYTTAPNYIEASQVIVPYEIHHGDSDITVPILADLEFDSILTANSIYHQFYIYHNENHFQTIHDSIQMQRSIQWFQSFSCSATHVESKDVTGNFSIKPNPVEDVLTIESGGLIPLNIQVYNAFGLLVLETRSSSFSVQDLISGIYFIRIQTDHAVYTERFFKL